MVRQLNRFDFLRLFFEWKQRRNLEFLRLYLVRQHNRAEQHCPDNQVFNHFEISFPAREHLFQSPHCPTIHPQYSLIENISWLSTDVQGIFYNPCRDFFQSDQVYPHSPSNRLYIDELYFDRNWQQLMTATSDIRLGFIGAGRMAQALARGIAKNAVPGSAEVNYFDPHDEAARIFESLHPDAVRQSSAALLCGKSNVILLAVKPQVMASVLEELKPVVDGHHLVISVAAGVSLATLAGSLPTKRLIRVMPNTPCLIGQGISAIACGPEVEEFDRAIATSLFAAAGKTVDVAEYQMDAVTGLSGSGPAYVFSFIEALIDGGVLAGLPHEIAMNLAIQTVRGSTELLAETGKSPADLRSEVTSPGGTTLAGLAVLEERGFRHTVMNAIVAATRRATELGGQ